MKANFMLAEFREPEALIEGIFELKKHGFRSLDAYLPYGVEAVEHALDHRPSQLPKLVFLGGILGASAAYALQWAINTRFYPLNVGGRPFHFPLAFIPITFEMGILLGAFTGFISVLIVGRLVRLWHPVFECPDMVSASRDGFWLQIDENDPAFDLVMAQKVLTTSGALRIARVGPTGVS